MKKICVVIPVLNPTSKIVSLVSDLSARGIKHIIVVDDGSGEEYKNTFSQLKKFSCIILSHKKNRGKGRALKTGFDYFINNFQEDFGLVTVDADGQHLVEDVVKLAAKLDSINDNTIFLGSRNFNNNTPFRSRVGNKLTKYLFYFLTGIKINDTQTGLRAIPRNLIKNLVAINGERYEYELNVLLELKENKINIEEESIKTIYIDDNKASHFRPLIDSFKIYFLFLKFILASLSSAFLDFMLFWLAFSFFQSIFYALLLSRLLSSLYNFTINKKLVFRSDKSSLKYLFKYYFLLFVLLTLNYLFIKLVSEELGWNVVLAKAIIEFLLFFASFHIQRRYIFFR